MFSYQITRSEDLNESIVVIIEGRPFTASSTHPNYRQIRHLLETDTREPFGYDDDLGEYEEAEQAFEAKLIDLFDATVAVGTKFDKLSERVRVAGGRVFFDGVEVNTVLTEQILRFHRAGLPFMALVNFFEKIATNPNEHSQDSLYAWLQAQGEFTITDDGDIIAYKGLTADHKSVHSGPAIVDGVQMNGQIPNELGSIIEMPRDKVNHDPMQGCSVGLHTGTFNFAQSFGHGVCAKVKVNPRDVVSVPTDCGAQKMRVCRYEVLELTEYAVQSPLYDHEYDDYDEDEYDDLDDELEVAEQEGRNVTVPAGTLRDILSTVRDLIRGR